MSRNASSPENRTIILLIEQEEYEQIMPAGVSKFSCIFAEAELSIIEYIEMFYNAKRLHQALEYRTPNEVEAEYAMSLTSALQ